jgi:(p)ppGpp synthase/HD superfamily hydrolase
MSQKLFQAIEFATKAHSGQFRKHTKIPYIVHPLGVAKILIESGCSEEVVVAGLLHDTVEDTEVTLDQIESEFGKEVARLVEGASEPDKSDSWDNRKKHTIDYLQDAPMDVVLVTFADKLDNMRAIRSDYEKIGDEVFGRFNEPKDKQRWYFESLAEVFSKRIADEPLVTLLRGFKAEIAKVFGKI